MANSIVKEKSFSFAVRIVKLYRYLCSERRDDVLAKQLLRCGTSIGANVTEAQGGISKADFRAKMSISLKECLECQYWLDLLLATDYLTPSEHQSMQSDCVELGKMLTCILKSTQ